MVGEYVWINEAGDLVTVTLGAPGYWSHVESARGWRAYKVERATLEGILGIAGFERLGEL